MSEALLKVPDAALEQARMMLDRARWGATRFQKLDRSTTQRIVNAVAAAAHGKAQYYAEWAVRETGMSVVAHKRMKNEACSKGLAETYYGENFVSPRIDEAKKIVELPRPAGVIFALIPVTNPVATVYFKTLLALMTRNAIILSPHPGAKACCADAARMLAEAAKAAGAPDGVIQVLEEPNIPLIEKLIADERIDLVVATGGQGEARAALARIAEGNHPVKLEEGDTVIFSSKQIPGNEIAIGHVMNHLARRNILTVTEKQAHVHVSGHPGRPELKVMYDWIRPELLVPVHGERRHMAEQARFGLACGIWTENFKRAWRIGRALEAGSVWINTYKQSVVSTPFGGFKNSGIGREKGIDGLRMYAQVKSMYFGLHEHPLAVAK